MAWYDDLKTRRDAIAAELKNLTSSAAGGLPNVSGEGVNVDHVGYRLSLIKELGELNAALDAAGVGPEADNQDSMGYNETEEF